MLPLPSQETQTVRDPITKVFKLESAKGLDLENDIMACNVGSVFDARAARPVHVSDVKDIEARLV